MRIISPWAVYWITRLDNFAVAFVVGTFILGFCSIAIAMFLFFEHDSLDDDDIKRVKKYLKTMLIAFGICLAGSVFTPTTKEAIEMVIADKVTYEAADEALERIGEVADHIIGEIKEEE